MSWTVQQKFEHAVDFVQCMRGLLNNQIGIHAVMETPLAVRCVATCLGPSHSLDNRTLAAPRKRVLELLAVVSRIDEFQPMAYNLVIDALEDIQLVHQLPSRFSCLMQVRAPKPRPLCCAPCPAVLWDGTFEMGRFF